MIRPLSILACLLVCAGPARASDPDHLDGATRAAAPLDATRAAADSIRYAVRITDNNQMGVTITNYGFIGNNFVSRAPSMEYPLGRGFEHLVRGGLWFGAHAIDESGRFTGVVTGAIDGAQGSSSQGATEYTPAGTEILTRSKLQNSRFFNPEALSEQDLFSAFSDRPARHAANNNEDHRPVGILVKQTNYSWSFSDYQHFTIFHFVIRNDGPPLDSAWVGFYSEFASGNKNAYSCWPPSSSCGPGSWFSRKWLAYDDSLRLFREHYCQSVPMPAACNLSYTPYWVGVKVLGSKHGGIPAPRVTVAPWKYSPGNTSRDEDVERYALMSSGTYPGDLDSNPDYVPQTGDPAGVIAFGPFPYIAPGDSISVDFALVGGADVADIQRHSQFAQRAFDRDYIVPIPPPSPRAKVVARHQALDVYWDDSPESATDPTSPNPQDFEGYRVYVGEDRLDLHRVAQFDLATPPNDTTGFNTGLAAIRLPQPVVIDGVTYHYRYTVPSVRDGFKYFVSVTAYDLGNSEIESLESGLAQNKTLAVPGPAPGEGTASGKVTVFPNPYRVEARWDQGRLVRDHYLWFANLPERCTIRIYTLSGDLVYETDFNGATYHADGLRGVYDPRRELDVQAPTLSGSTFGWDLISREGQAAATGLYIYSIEDKTGGPRSVGKFLVIKSDRENF
jgi:hypothetical protein